LDPISTFLELSSDNFKKWTCN